MLEKWSDSHFKPADFACKCAGCREKFGAGVNPIFERNLLELAGELEKLFRWLNKPIEIVEALRCVGRNNALKEPKASQHLLGLAARIRVDGETGESLRGRFETLIKLRAIRNGGLGTFAKKKELFHYDLRKTGAARWVK